MFEHCLSVNGACEFTGTTDECYEFILNNLGWKSITESEQEPGATYCDIIAVKNDGEEFIAGRLYDNEEDQFRVMPYVRWEFFLDAYGTKIKPKNSANGWQITRADECPYCLAEGREYANGIAHAQREAIGEIK